MREACIGEGTRFALLGFGKELRAHAAARRALFALAIAPLLSACTGAQSALDPAGEEASQVAQLFWAMLIGSGVIWAGVMLLALYASRWKRREFSEKSAGRLILWAGVVFPVAVLAALLSFALWLMPSLRPFAGEQAKVQIEVTGHQFWWHVVYHRPDGTTVSSANEIRMPVGERVEFRLASADMIHSFWIPALGGKMDLIPGRINRLSLLATKPGRYRGQCAEFCGMSHALMAFPVVAMDPQDFETWLSERQAPSSGIAASGSGRALFEREKCGDCHRVAGTPAAGTSGPDLSNIGSRLTVGAGQMDNDPAALARFIAHSGSVKPGSQMPAYPNLSAEELDEIARWLKALQ
jgi:cytochrome c oxidase subunit 2